MFIVRIVEDCQLAAAWAAVYLLGTWLLFIRRGSDTPEARAEARAYVERQPVALGF